MLGRNAVQRWTCALIMLSASNVAPASDDAEVGITRGVTNRAWWTPTGGCTTLDAPTTRGTYEPTRTWPDGDVPYAFDANVSAVNQSQTLAAMREIEAVARIRFKPRTDEINHLHIRHSSGNASFVGMVGGAQDVHINGWSNRFVIVHELMHALGIHHEQSRADRDQYVVINHANIVQGRAHNFNVVPTSLSYGPYDFDSIMHYNQFAFSANGQPTITLLPPYQHLQGAIGQLTHLSEGDIDTLRHLYRTDSPVPDAENDTVVAVAGQTTIIPHATLLQNDFDLDDDPLSIGDVTDPAHGNLNDAFGVISYTPNPGYIGLDTFTYTITDDDGADTATVTIDVIPPPRFVYVDHQATGTGDGSSWANAKTTLETALTNAEAGDEIRVAPGVYEAAVFVVPDAVTLRSGYAPGADTFRHADRAVLSSTSGRVLECINGSDRTIIDGFIIADGFANDTADADRSARGGGAFIDGGAPWIRRCDFINNRAISDGGAVYARNTLARFEACRFRANQSTGDDAGAAYVEGGRVRFASCTFNANHAADLGGAVYAFAAGVVEMANCTIVHNTSDDRAGAIFVNALAQVDLRNSILWANTAPVAGAHATAINGGVISMTSSLVEEGTDGISLENGYLSWPASNADANPAFEHLLGPDGLPGTGDERLNTLPGSPTIDAGENAALLVDESIDIDGNPRRIDAAAYADVGTGVGAIIDIGAFETNATTPTAPLGVLEVRFVVSDSQGFGVETTEVHLDSESVDLYVQARISGDPLATRVTSLDARITPSRSGVLSAAPLTNAETFELPISGDDVLARTGLFPKFRAHIGHDNTPPANGTSDGDDWTFTGVRLPDEDPLDGWETIYKVRWTPSVLGRTVLISGGTTAIYDSLIGPRTPAASTTGSIGITVPITCACEVDDDPAEVTIDDLLLFLQWWFTDDPRADVDPDGVVDLIDLLHFIDCWIDAPSGCE